jgi:hypothetical protein
MEFKAQKIDLKLELTTITGEELVLDSPNVAAGQAVVLITKFMDMDKDMVDNHKKDPVFAMKNLDEQLAAIYGTEESWWPENFDYTTLLEIKGFVFNSLAAIRKKE